MARSRNFFCRDYAGHKGATAFLISCVLSFIFLVIGTPLGVLQVKADTSICYTLWGTRKCDSPDYDFRIAWDTCSSRRIRFEFAEACTIIAMFFMVINGLMCCHCIANWNGKWWTFAVSLITVASNFVPWTVVASLYNTSYCGSDTYTKAHTKYGPGFPLLLVSFCVHIVGVVCLIALEPYEKVEVVDKRKRTQRAQQPGQSTEPANAPHV